MSCPLISGFQFLIRNKNTSKCENFKIRFARMAVHDEISTDICVVQIDDQAALSEVFAFTAVTANTHGAGTVVMASEEIFDVSQVIFRAF
jgi:hypothetical protein